MRVIRGSLILWIPCSLYALWPMQIIIPIFSWDYLRIRVSRRSVEVYELGHAWRRSLGVKEIPNPYLKMQF